MKNKIVITLKMCCISFVLIFVTFSCRSSTEDLLNHLNLISLDLTLLVDHLNNLNVNDSADNVTSVLDSIEENIIILTSEIENNNVSDNEIIKQIKTYYLPELELILVQVCGFASYIDGLTSDVTLGTSNDWLDYNSKADELEVNLVNFIELHNELLGGFLKKTSTHHHALKDMVA